MSSPLSTTPQVRTAEVKRLAIGWKRSLNVFARVRRREEGTPLLQRAAATTRPTTPAHVLERANLMRPRPHTPQRHRTRAVPRVVESRGCCRA